MSAATVSIARSTDRALEVFRAAIGSAHVITGSETLGLANTATFPTRQNAIAILQPGTVEEVRAVVRAAGQMGVSLHPYSAGKNIGYGSRVAPQDGCALLDLGRLNRILAHDERLAYITVEPGVTFQQAHDYLAHKSSRLALATIGGPPSASLVGNALERGDADGAYADVFSHVCGLEVVLATGEVVHTGQGWLPGAASAPLHRWGVGASLDGLFSQSSLGIVTKLTLHLAPRATYLNRFSCGVDTDAGLSALVDDVQELMLEGTLQGGVFLWNDLKRISTAIRYPYAATACRTPLPEPLRVEIRRSVGLGAWTVSGTVRAADASVGRAISRRVKALLCKEGRFFRDRLDMPEGVPSARNLAMAYWRKRREDGPPARPFSPEKDGCGFLWHSAAVPFTGEQAVKASGHAARLIRMFGFEANLSFSAVSPRCLYLIAALAYDREVRGEDERAMACFAALKRELAQAGYWPTRLGVQSVGFEWPATDDTPRLLRKLKAALDPCHTLSPGRPLGGDF